MTYFSFHRLPSPPRQPQQRMLSRLMPHMHCAVTRIRPAQEVDAFDLAPVPGSEPALTQRQREIARWMMRGKSNWEIAHIVGTSEANVNGAVQGTKAHVHPR